MREQDFLCLYHHNTTPLIRNSHFRSLSSPVSPFSVSTPNQALIAYQASHATPAIQSYCRRYIANLRHNCSSQAAINTMMLPNSSSRSLRTTKDEFLRTLTTFLGAQAAATDLVSPVATITQASKETVQTGNPIATVATVLSPSHPPSWIPRDVSPDTGARGSGTLNDTRKPTRTIFQGRSMPTRVCRDDSGELSECME
jgi:hypothetical protein